MGLGLIVGRRNLSNLGAALEAMLIAKTLEHQLRRVALPAVHRAVTLQLAINDAGEPVQLRPLHGHRPPDNPPEPRTLTSYARYRAKSRNAAQPPAGSCLPNKTDEPSCKISL